MKSYFIQIITKSILFSLVLIPTLTLAGPARLVSINTAGTNSGNDFSFNPVITSDGRYVAFSSTASDLVTNDTNGDQDIFIRDLQSGTTTLVSVNMAGTNSGNRSSENPNITPDGRYVVFSSSASDLVVNDTNDQQDIFVRDLQNGTTSLVSVNTTGTDSGNSDSNEFSLTPDGRYVVFSSSASDLVVNDTNDQQDIFVRDLQSGTTSLISVNTTGTNGGNDFSFDPVITSDGRYVAFSSSASDLVAADTNGFTDVFVRDLQSGTTSLVSINMSGTNSGDEISSEVRITPDGRYILFGSSASNLVATDTNGFTDVFVRDLQSGTTSLVSMNLLGTDSGNLESLFKDSAFITPDGRYVVFVSGASDLIASDTNERRDIFIRDLQSGTTSLVSMNTTGTNGGNGNSGYPNITPDGRYIAFTSRASDLVATDTNGREDTFIHDLQNGTTYLVSMNLLGTNSGNHNSFRESVITPDGRYLAFQSLASDLITTDANGVMDIFLQKFIIDTPTANSLTTTSTTPTLTGTWDYQYATALVVTLNGTTYTLGTNPELSHNGTGTWTLIPSTLTPTTYTIQVMNTNFFGSRTGTGTLTIQSVSGSSGGGGGNINYLCKDPKATNYDDSEFGRHKDSLCKYTNSTDIQEALAISNPDKSCPYFTTYQRKGAQNNEVKLIQSFLSELGFYTGTLDSIYGSLTDTAIRAFQRKHTKEILIPWNHSTPTGRWYQSTRNHANMLSGCDEGPVTLDNGVVID